LSAGVGDEFFGEIDGENISPEEAEDLWHKYEEVASVVDLDQKLANYVNDSGKKAT